MIYMEDGSVIGSPEEIIKHAKENNIALDLTSPVKPMRIFCSEYEPIEALPEEDK